MEMHLSGVVYTCDTYERVDQQQMFFSYIS